MGRRATRRAELAQHSNPAACSLPCKTWRCRQRGLRVVGETVASAISRDESALWDPDFDRAAQFVMSPPIRSK